MKTIEKDEKMTLDERVEKLKKNLDDVSESSKETIKEIIASCTKQAKEALETNKKMIETVRESLKEHGIDTSIIDAIHDTIGTAVELSEEVVDSIIDAHLSRINLTVDFQKKYLEALKEQSLTNKVDYDQLVDILQENFENSVELSTNNMKEVIYMYNKHVNLTLNFNEKFNKSINYQIETMTEFYKKRAGMYSDWVSNWWENVSESNNKK